MHRTNLMSVCSPLFLTGAGIALGYDKPELAIFFGIGFFVSMAANWIDKRIQEHLIAALDIQEMTADMTPERIASFFARIEQEQDERDEMLERVTMNDDEPNESLVDALIRSRLEGMAEIESVITRTDPAPSPIAARAAEIQTERQSRREARRQMRGEQAIQEQVITPARIFTEFPGNRERIGTVSIGGGEIDVYIPNVHDTSSLNASDPDYGYKLSAKAINMPYQEFQELSFQDAAGIMELLSNAMWH